MDNFDERSGIVACDTEWGRWWQTLDEVFVEVTSLPDDIRAKEIKCEFKPSSLKVTVRGSTLIDGKLPEKIHSEDAIWTLGCTWEYVGIFYSEDKKLLRICLSKSITTASKCWKSLLTGEYEANPWVYDQMEQKITLQRFQKENPGMDFSGASISGNYQGGGPSIDT